MPNIQQDSPKIKGFFAIYNDPDSPDHVYLSIDLNMLMRLHRKALRRSLLVLLGLLLSLNLSGLAEVVTAIIQP